MKDQPTDCPFCDPDPDRNIIMENEIVFATYDKFPVSKGHALIIPKRHCGDYFELTDEEQSSCWKMVNEIKKVLSKEFKPDGFNIGVNIGETAGQTINHVHIHVIPRFKGDIDNPEGGVRGVIPEKRLYKSNIGQEQESKPLSFLQSKNQVLELISRADDDDETKRLITKFAELKKMREPFFLKMDEFDEILHWKLRSQYHRQHRNINRNTEDLIREVTKAAFSIESTDVESEIALTLKTLIKLHGVEVPVASAIMTLCYPEKYCVIDFRGWRQVFGKEKEYASYSTKDYIKYWSIIKQKADEFGITPQQIDMAIWQHDIEGSRR